MMRTHWPPKMTSDSPDSRLMGRMSGTAIAFCVCAQYDVSRTECIQRCSLCEGCRMPCLMLGRKAGNLQRRPTVRAWCEAEEQETQRLHLYV